MEQTCAGACGARGQSFGQGPDPAGTSRAQQGESHIPTLGGYGGSSSQGEAEHVLLCAVIAWPPAGIPDPGLELPCLQRVVTGSLTLYTGFKCGEINVIILSL